MDIEIFTPNASKRYKDLLKELEEAKQEIISLSSALEDAKQQIATYNPNIVLQTSIIQFIVTDDKEFLNNVNIVGALLSYDTEKSIYTVWNGTLMFWDPYSTSTLPLESEYGNVIAVCVGKGLWAAINWSGLSTMYKWSNYNDDIYNMYHAISIHGNGIDSTNHIYEHHASYIQDTVWQHLLDESTNDYMLYLPSKLEALEVFNHLCDNNHAEDQVKGVSGHTFEKSIGQLFQIQEDLRYWTSSQCASKAGDGDFNRVFYLYTGNYAIDNTYKDYIHRTVALIKFK